MVDTVDEKTRQRKIDFNKVFGFVCYANENRLPKDFQITNHQFDEIEFWLVNSEGEKVNANNFRAELLLELKY
ncbi:hypothetical protein FACS189472_14660 [Alphaproteobacteria bacterium]|nr:hypothetical protein FACS189472_14660 [Alphaproteobacteria bacterium]